MFNLEAFAARLKGIRIELCLSQEALAHKLGISRVALSYYENGQRTPDIAFLHSLHEATGYPLEYLMGMSEARETENISLSRITGLNDTALDLMLKNADKINELTYMNPDDFEDLLHLTAPSLWRHFFRLIADSSPADCEKAFNAISELKALYNNIAQRLLSNSQCLGYGDLTKDEHNAIRENMSYLRNRKTSLDNEKVSLFGELSELANHLSQLPGGVESGLLELEKVEQKCQTDYPHFLT